MVERVKHLHSNLDVISIAKLGVLGEREVEILRIRVMHPPQRARCIPDGVRSRLGEILPIKLCEWSRPAARRFPIPPWTLPESEDRFCCGSVVEGVQHDRITGAPVFDPGHLPAVHQEVSALAGAVEEKLAVPEGTFIDSTRNDLVIDVLSTDGPFTLRV